MKLRGVLLVFLMLFPVLAHAESSALIISGVPGDDEHMAKFAKWTETTRKTLVDKMGFNASRVLVLSGEKTAKDDIKSAFARLKEQLRPDDMFFLFMIGHGSFDGLDYKFNIYGPDFTAAEYNGLLATLNVARIVIVNGSEASGGATGVLAGKNRMIVSATKSGVEGNDTVFYEYFLNGLQDAAADENKDQKVSVWEAFKFAVDGVERFYKESQRIQTEHPQISDNGSPMTGVVPQAPLLASMTTFNVVRPVTVADSKLQALLNDQVDIQRKIDSLKINQASMAPADFDKQMEDLLIQLALNNQQIQAQRKN